jgi:hypothetical protein
MGSRQHATEPDTLRRLAGALEICLVIGLESGPNERPTRGLSTLRNARLDGSSVPIQIGTRVPHGRHVQEAGGGRRQEREFQAARVEQLSTLGTHALTPVSQQWSLGAL